MSGSRLPHSRRSLVLLGTVVAVALVVGGLGLTVLHAAGSISLTNFGTAYTQNFDTLASSGTSSVVPDGWAFSESGTNANTTYAAGTGSGTTGDTYSFGATGSSERAFGGLLSGSLVPTIGASFTNNTGGAITSLAISYTGEQWRWGGSASNRGAAADRLDFQLSTNATSLTTGAWTDYNALDFSSPVTSGTTGALNGNVAPNRTAISATITGLNIPNGATFWIRWSDFNVTGSDDGLAVDDFSIIPIGVAGDTAPRVATVVPANGAGGVSRGASVVVTFSEPVDVTGGWYSLSCVTSGAHSAVVTGGPTVFTIDPDADFVYGETCSFTISAANVTDQDTDDPPDNMTADFAASFTVMTDPCTSPYKPIHDIQGTGPTVAVTGTVTTRGVVVGDYEGPSPALRGFFIQDPTGDGNTATSDGIFVFEGSNANTVSLGDLVVVTGTAGENQGQSQISVGSITVCGAGSVAPTDVTLPFATADDAERYEGMLVRFPQTLYVTETYNLSQFGQVTLSSDSRLPQPTDVAAPGDPALAQQAVNDLNQIILDDASQAQDPDPIVFGRGGQPLSASNTLRGGDTATGMVGVFNYTWGGYSTSPNAWRIRPIGALGGSVYFEPANPRPDAPAQSGTLRIMSGNLMNYFNTFTGCTGGVGGASMGCRGAFTQTEFDRQWPKTVAAILASGADVLGLTEVENDGYGAGSAIQDLADKLNAASGSGTWAFIDFDAGTGQVNAGGTDAIKSAIFYKTARVTPTGQTAALNTEEFVNGGNRTPGGRPTLAQAFVQNDNGVRFVLVVNHFRSKGTCDIPDAGDGQGGCSVVRKNQATALAAWLSANPTGDSTPNVLLVGDFNAYTKEDPITILTGAGYTNLDAGPGVYSYVYDGQWGSLDHALASPALEGRVTLAEPFHINADEPPALDYSTAYKSTGQLVSLYAPDQFRAADHDQLIVDVNLENNRPVVQIDGKPIGLKQNETITLHATGADLYGGPVTYAWDLDNDGTFETAGQDVLFSGAGKFGQVTVKVRVTDNSGLTGDDTAAITVSFNWDGFFSPVKNGPTVNQAKAGSAVPLKFSLGGDQGLVIFKTGFPVSIPVACDDGTQGVGTPTANPGHSGLSYDSGGYNYVWKTDKSWKGTCRLVVVTLVDGSTHSAIFNLK